MSKLRAKCPDCKTYTAVALGPCYECHTCGREFNAGLVRVPRAWGADGDAMAEAARLPFPYPETAVVDEGTLGEQSLVLATELPDRPLVVGGCCCAHIGAVEALAARHGRIAVVWLDAHGDLNTPATSQSGNLWGMPLRMVIDGGTVDAQDVALVGARNLDPPELEFIEQSGLHNGEDAVERAVDEVSGTYVAFDVDVLAPGELSMHMEEPGGPSLAEIEQVLALVRERSLVLGVGLSGMSPDPANVEPLARSLAALGL
ncbi:MAG: arginase family protein [Actinomycetota bacterium]|nr:arginase family protein [Actinomycetota bacterium]